MPIVKLSLPHRPLESVWFMIMLAIFPAALCVNGSCRCEAASTASATVYPTRLGSVIARSFLGLSIEYGPTVENMVSSHEGHRASLAVLLNRLGRYNGPAVLRIGGNSEDMAAWNLSALHPRPAGVTINITPKFCHDIRALCRRTGDKLILGINLGRGTVAMAKTWVRQALHRIGGKHILAFEIGNEADAYVLTHQRPKGYTLEEYEADFSRFASAITPLMPRPGMIAGPAFSCFWLKDQTADFIRAAHEEIGLVTIHDYPLGIRRAIANPRSPRYDSIAHLLNNHSSYLFNSMLTKTVAMARQYDLPVRWGEMNSAAGGGDVGISDSFASALWLTDTLFEAADGGAVGVNLHNAGAGLCPYSVFTYSHTGQLVPHPDYYAMLLFAMASQHNARLISVKTHTKANIKIWATRDNHGTVRVVIINKQQSRSADVAIHLSGYGAAKMIGLSAPSVIATAGVTLGGMAFDRNRMIGTPKITTVSPRDGRYDLAMPAAGAAMLTLNPN